MFILEAIAAFGNWFWGLPILFLIVGGGIYITIRLGFVQFRKFGYICSQTFGKMFSKSGRRRSIFVFCSLRSPCVIHRSLQHRRRACGRSNGRSRSSILDLAHSLNRLRNQVLRDRSGDQIQRKERSRRMGRRRSLLSESIRRRHRQVLRRMVRYRPDDRTDPFTLYSGSVRNFSVHNTGR